MAVTAMGVFTIGHSTRSFEAFLELLREHAVERVIDVRTMPRSRRHPHFDREHFPGALAATGIDYRHVPGLGGLRRARSDSRNVGWKNASFRGYADYMETPEFAAALCEGIELANEKTSALVCAEAVPWRCHRSLIADALVARGVDVRHIIGRGPAKAHVLAPWARLEGLHVTYPGLPLEAVDER